MYQELATAEPRKTNRTSYRSMGKLRAASKTRRVARQLGTYRGTFESASPSYPPSTQRLALPFSLFFLLFFLPLFLLFLLFSASAKTDEDKMEDVLMAIDASSKAWPEKRAGVD